MMGERGHHATLQKSQSFGFNSNSGTGFSNGSGSGASVGGRQAREAQVRDQSRAEREVVRSRSSSCDDSDRVNSKMYQKKKQNFDPLAALPTSHNKQYHRNVGGQTPPHSPSPTQSEYDTCDPWDDY